MHNYAGDPFLLVDGQVWKLTFHFFSAPIEKAKGHSYIFFFPPQFLKATQKLNPKLNKKQSCILTFLPLVIIYFYFSLFVPVST